MKYRELINFEPITEVVKFSETHKTDYQKNLVKTFVFSDTFLKSAKLLFNLKMIKEILI